jgi:hypothetical protein
MNIKSLLALLFQDFFLLSGVVDAWVTIVHRKSGIGGSEVTPDYDFIGGHETYAYIGHIHKYSKVISLEIHVASPSRKKLKTAKIA